ncbi:MAG: AAA family ATPase [Desulfobacteraceae bacterium]|nr:MAG: AAA family ATPase [Desulfobacteraceae bacterium]
MYRKFFGFSEKPFDVTPDPRFLYLSPTHQEMLASLIYGIRERRGFITIIGEVGTGKTTLLNTVLDRLDENTKVAFIFNTDVSFMQMLIMALVDLGAARSKEKLSKVEALSRLNNFTIQQLAKGINVVLIVDEAQNLDLRTMESMRLLSNLETRKHKLVQIILSGQPELDVKLSKPELRQLAQRISLKRYITPLTEKETYEYIQHRLIIAGYKGPSLFSRKAKQLVWEYSGGVPRKINILCDNAFLIGYGLRNRKISESVVDEAIKDLSWSPFSVTIESQAVPPMEQPLPQVMRRASRPRFKMFARLVLTACLFFALGLTLRSQRIKLQGLPSFLYNSVMGIKSANEQNTSDQSPAREKSASEAQTKEEKKIAPSEGSQEKVKPETKSTSELKSSEQSLVRAESASGKGTALDGSQEKVEPEIKSASKLKRSAQSPTRAESVSNAQTTEHQKVALSDSSQENSEPYIMAVGEHVHDSEKSLDLSVDTNEEDPLLNYEADQSERDVSVIRMARDVVAENGDTLSSIIMREYGTYDEEILSTVLQENPQIQNPDLISTGQVIALPVLGDNP